MLEQMKSMITRRGRLYRFAFYRILSGQAEDAVKAFHAGGHCAFKMKVLDGKGASPWAIYDGGKRKRMVITKKKLQERNMKLMHHHLTRARDAFQQYKNNKGKEDFHFTTEEWDTQYGLNKAYDFGKSIEEAIYVVEEKME